MSSSVKWFSVCCIACFLLPLFQVVSPASLHYDNRNALHQRNGSLYYEDITKNLILQSSYDGGTILEVLEIIKKFPNFFTHLFEIFNIKKFQDRISDATEHARLCISCKVGVGILQFIVSRKHSEAEVGNIVKKICTIFRIETDRVCQGLTKLFRHEVTQVLSQVVLAPNEICALMVDRKCGKFVNPLHNWTVPLTPFPKPPVKPIPPPKPGSPVVKVLQLSDTHWDPYYQEGAYANCKEPLCCRASSGTPPSIEDHAGRWGDYRNCDTPLRTLESMLKHIRQAHKIDYVIWTGDILPHDIWNNSRKEAVMVVRSASQLLKKYFGDIPIFPAIGNHESSPVNSFPIPQVTGNDSISWLYDELFTAWSPWLSSSTMETMKLGAYYSVAVHSGFRIISINTNYCNNLNWWLLLNSTDPAFELHWLVRELQMAEDSGEKVHIIGHIPPGNSDCLWVWSHNYHNIINRYESTVTAQFFGHTHKDEYEVFYDTLNSKGTNRATNIAYIGPSVTTYDGVNPSYRIYSVDGNYINSSWVVLDHETYYLNLTAANLEDKPQWRFEYSAQEAYNMTSLLPAEWNKLTERLSNDDKLFQKFYRYYTHLSDYFKKPCVGKCKRNLLCRLKRGISRDISC